MLFALSMRWFHFILFIFSIFPFDVEVSLFPRHFCEHNRIYQSMMYLIDGDWSYEMQMQCRETQTW